MGGLGVTQHKSLSDDVSERLQYLSFRSFFMGMTGERCFTMVWGAASLFNDLLKVLVTFIV